MRWQVILVLGAMLAGCAQPKPGGDILAGDAVACTEPRPQICTMIYDPVCATRSDGTRTTEASNCSACGIAEVVSYTFGACPGDDKPSPP